MTTAYAPIPSGPPHEESRKSSDRSRSSNSTQIVENHFSEADAISQRSTPDMGNSVGAKSAHSGFSDRSLEVSGDDVFDEQHSARAGHAFDHTIEAPIVGHEVMEQRARFTVFKINVRKGPLDTWFIFRRYTDFVRLNDKLRVLFPGFRLALPPKRWFGDNFDLCFLEDRIIGLQAFMSNILGHREVSISRPVIEFFCLDDPPGPHDSLEDSRALCESLEETAYNLRKDLQERDARIELLQEELSLLKTETDGMRKVLNSRRSSPGSMHSTGSVLDLNSYTEADSAHMSRNLGQTVTEYVSEQDALLRSTESGSVLAVNSSTNSQETLKLFNRKGRAIKRTFKT